NVEPRAELASAVADLGPRMSQVVVRAVTRGLDARGPRQLSVLAFEVSERVCACSVVDVEHKQSGRAARDNRDIRVRPLLPPCLDQSEVGRRVQEAALRGW